DDAIVGMIIIAKAYSDDISVFKNNYNKTTNISRNMILNIIDNRASDNIKNLYENDDINRVLELVKEIGSSSGIDMIVGTFLYIKKRRGEFCLRSSF
uniref:oxamate carbamoyltransferase subunit AllH family protein n=1 Tax=Brachyspira pilosicoli TaxID=52584 RepID=UPI0012F52503